MMAMIAFLAFSLAEDPGLAPAWNTLLLSKTCSSLLYAWSAWSRENSLFLAGSLLDGGICLHLLVLRWRLAPEKTENAMSPRLARRQGPFHEAWFAKLNDPATRNALWLRCALSRSGKDPIQASGWYVLFNPSGGRTLSGRWSPEQALNLAEDRGGIPDDLIGKALLMGQENVALWLFNISGKAGPRFDFAPRLLSLCGLKSDYCSLGLARFDGFLSIGGERFLFHEAHGSLGHFWGRGLPAEWRWGHAVFSDGPRASVFEILSAQLKFRGLRLPALTTAHLWHKGIHYSGQGLWRGLRSCIRAEEGQAWSFRTDLGTVTVEGLCTPSALSAELEYRDPGGRQLLCRNSKTGSMRLHLLFKDGRPEVVLETADAAAVEWVREGP
jgi:hypothetical protein